MIILEAGIEDKIKISYIYVIIIQRCLRISNKIFIITAPLFLAHWLIRWLLWKVIVGLRLFVLVLIKIVILWNLAALLRWRSWIFFCSWIDAKIVFNAELLAKSCIQVMAVDFMKHPLKCQRHSTKRPEAVTVWRILLLLTKLLSYMTILDFLIFQNMVK